MASSFFNLNRLFFGVVLGFFLLALFHFESFSVGPLKVSHLWKGTLLFILMAKVFRGGTVRSSVYNSFFMLSVLILLSLEVFYNPLNAIFTCATTVIIPLMGVYFLQKNYVWCKNALYFLSAFYILCFVPYELNLLAPLGEGYDLEKSFGFVVHGSIGPFQTVHSASTALAGSLIVILFFLITSEFNRLWLSFLFVLGFYLLLHTYVRTGMAMFAVGALMMLGSFASRDHRMFLRVMLLAIAMMPFVSAWVLSNDALMARLRGERTHNAEMESLENIGSGRGGMAIDALEIYAEGNIFEQIFGMGITEQKIRMGLKRGAELIPHNGFLSLLTHQGLLGFILFISFLFALWRAIGRLKSPDDMTLLRSLLLPYVVMTFFQSYDMLYMPVLMMLAFAWKTNLNEISKVPSSK